MKDAFHWQKISVIYSRFKADHFSSQIWCLHYCYFKKFSVLAEINNYMVSKEGSAFHCVLHFLPVSMPVFLICHTPIVALCHDRSRNMKKTGPQLQFKTPVWVWEHAGSFPLFRWWVSDSLQKWSGLEDIISTVIASEMSLLWSTKIGQLRFSNATIKAGQAVSHIFPSSSLPVC